jgi:hypothetical protein
MLFKIFFDLIIILTCIIFFIVNIINKNYMNSVIFFILLINSFSNFTTNFRRNYIKSLNGG